MNFHHVLHHIKAVCYTYIVTQKDQPILNTQKLEEIVALYKVPLIFALLGTVLLLIPIIWLVKHQSVKGSDIVFETVDTLATGSGTLRVDVAGAVTYPGVYQFGWGERIEDALIRAGGLSKDADRNWLEKNLNRAAKLTDGGKLYIPKAGELLKQGQVAGASGERTLGVTTGLIKINSASQSELEQLPGVGPVTAGNIISGRPYASIEELKARKIIGEALFEKVKDLITAP